MASDLSELYQAVILDHNRRPRNYGAAPDDANKFAQGDNPLCGDRVQLWLRVDGDTIADVGFEGVGCAISRASASVMTAAVKGKSVADAEALFERFHDLVTGKAAAGSEHKTFAAFSGVARYPIRVKCASLPWHALKSALAS